MQTNKFVTRAQRNILATLHRCSLTPIEKRTAAHNRLSGRGVARSLAVLKRLGLISLFEEYHSPVSTWYYAHMSQEGRVLAAQCHAEYQAQLEKRIAKRHAVATLN